MGAVNGEGSYHFILTRIDADVNDNDTFKTGRFRIKIWREATDGTENIFYDMGLGAEERDYSATTEVRGGSIIVHDGSTKGGGKK